MTMAEATVARRATRFMAVNRGIVVGSVYGALAVIATILAFRRASGEVLGTVAALGFVAGAIVGFSNLRAGSDARDVPADLGDGLMAAVWTAVLALLANLVFLRFRPALLYPVLACFAVAALGGAAAGVPVLGFLSRLKVKGRRPFRFIVDATAGIANEDVRFVVRVVLQTLVFAALVAVGLAVVAILIGLLVLWLVFSLLSGDRSRRTVVVREAPAPRRATAIPKHGRVREDGTVVKEGLLTDTPTGQRVDGDGRVLREGLLTDTPTGLQIREDGRVVREGLLTDTPTGVRLVPDGVGGARVGKEGLLSDHDTCVRISENGRARDAGLTGADASLEIAPDGTVRVDGKERP